MTLSKDEIDGSLKALNRAHEAIQMLWTLATQVRCESGLVAGARMTGAIRDLDAAMAHARATFGRETGLADEQTTPADPD
jgi:hypothetical protein